ncbi:PEP/pyruvate-binding domain-containing protein [Paenibacillus ginsengarvi]|uniref:Pyruvate phosphate dikinase AMP/ATP-binding domain-containing protein n=1 Tax=Paenibacillus ginsengarvi TaxID=400777 RepID=A0A3B0C7C2_9BACL|nr:PEP/pyruvate-binding domain-containing protein [Paenibacillus ginsengarvi]RKN81973.1 hypothetical protein D7M11_18515 [Paenibacillus ginsengarvi]
MSGIISLSDASAEDAVGSKAYTLALLLQSHFPVPKGFVIAAQAFQRAVQHDPDPALRMFPEALCHAIMEAYRTFVTPPVVVRSSCSAEDSKSASFAGQYETILHVTEDNLLESIQRCWLSCNQDHVRTYMAQRYSAGRQTAALSVIVQELIDADGAGVLFSKNPVTGNEDEVVINSSFGLGEAVASGLVTPDFHILSKRRKEIVARELGDKTSKVILGGSGTRVVETTPAEQTDYSLRDEQLHELLGMAIAIETCLGYPVDIEFAYRSGQLYILQARRIST